MAQRILAFDFTTNPKDAEVIQKKIFTDVDVTTIFRVFQGVRSEGLRIPLANRLRKIIKKLPTNQRTPTGNLLDITNRILSVKDMGVTLEQDSTQLYNTIEEQFLNSGMDSEDLTGTQVQKLIEDVAAKGTAEDLPRIAFFADVTDPSSDYDQTDGLWKNIEALAVSYPTMKVATAIPTTLPTAADDIIALYDSLYAAQTVDMRAIPSNEKLFIVNGEIREALYNAYTSKSSVTADRYLSMIQLRDGYDVLAFKGIPVIAMWNWTQIITDDLGGNKIWRMLLTDKENLCIGTDVLTDVMDLRFEFHKYQSTNTLRSRFKFGTQVLYPDGLVYRTSAAATPSILGAYDPTNANAVIAANTVSGLTPLVAGTAGGSAHTIRGRGFTGTTGAGGVKVGVTNVTSYVVVNDTTITFVAPAKTAGPYTVTVTSPIGTSAASAQSIVFS